MTKSSPFIRARQISEADIEAMAELFGHGFGSPVKLYRQIFEILRAHETPPGFPKYGWLLEVDGVIVGGLILVYSDIGLNGCSAIRCHVAAWYFKPEFRSYSTILNLRALGHKEVTYVNLTAAPVARPIIEAQGFQKYSQGQFFAVPVLKFGFATEIVKLVKTESLPEKYKGGSEYDLVLDHERYGCIGIWCVTPNSAHPFVFQRRSIKRFVPGVRLIYCRDVSELVRFSAPLGSYLAARGMMVISIDANEAIRGLPGRYCDDLRPLWYKGTKPRLGDLAYTLRAIFPLYSTQLSYAQVLGIKLQSLAQKISNRAITAVPVKLVQLRSWTRSS
jgi:hypothetical protein